VTAEFSLLQDMFVKILQPCIAKR